MLTSHRPPSLRRYAVIPPARRATSCPPSKRECRFDLPSQGIGAASEKRGRLTNRVTDPLRRALESHTAVVGAFLGSRTRSSLAAHEHLKLRLVLTLAR